MLIQHCLLSQPLESQMTYVDQIQCLLSNSQKYFQCLESLSYLCALVMIS